MYAMDPGQTLPQGPQPDPQRPEDPAETKKIEEGKQQEFVMHAYISPPSVQRPEDPKETKDIEGGKQP